MQNDRPYVWVLDSARTPLASCLDAFSEWAEYRYSGPEDVSPSFTEDRPDAVFFSAEIDGGPEGEMFRRCHEQADGIPILAVAAVRSLAQAVAYFRAGAADYLSLPLEADSVFEQFDAARDKAEKQTLSSVVVELEAVDGDTGHVSLTLAHAVPEDVDDILAELTADCGDAEDDEPVAVDGLPIPTLWEELPCGLLVFDSDTNLAFSNQHGLDLFGMDSLADMQRVLETDPGRFRAYAANNKPLPDNHWPHILAGKTKTARSAVISIEVSEKRRLWLRIDCLPHIADGGLSRLTMSVINLTGELPPLSMAEPAAIQPKKEKRKKRGKRG